MKRTVLLLLPDYTTDDWPRDALHWQEVEIGDGALDSAIVTAALLSAAHDLEINSADIQPLYIIYGGIELTELAS